MAKRGLQHLANTTYQPPSGYKLVTYRILPERFPEVKKPKIISIPEKLETIARRLTSDLRSDYVDFSFSQIAKQTLKHDIALTLSHIDNEKALAKQIAFELRSREFEFEIELKTVRTNRAYRGFDYSDAITNRLLAIEREHRASLGIQQERMQLLHDRLWQQLKQLLGRLSYTDNDQQYGEHQLARSEA